MLIIPFIHINNKDNNLNIHRIRLLTIGGRYLWEENEQSSIEKQILEPNDIHVLSVKKIQINNKIVVLCEVDTHKTNTLDFYKWDELDVNDTETFCWRDYYYFSGGNNQKWLSTPKNEKIGDIKLETLFSHIFTKETEVI